MKMLPPKVKKAEKGKNGQTTRIFVLATFPAHNRAGDGARTHDSHVGNVALYH